jgi:hypothetical protein
VLVSNVNMAATLPAFHRYETEPPIEAYHDYFVDESYCLARRTDEDHADRRWNYAVYASYQCKSRPVVGSDLCEICQCRETKGTIRSGWNGRVNAPIPAASHMPGSKWFTDKAKWIGIARPKSRRMAERADERRLIADKEIKRFTDGKVTLNIEEFSAGGQITCQQLRDMVCVLSTPKRPTGADCINGHNTREKLCKLIRVLMNASVPEKPKFTVHYPVIRSSSSSSSETSSIASSAEATELATVKAERDALAAELAALKAKMADAVAVLCP